MEACFALVQLCTATLQLLPVRSSDEAYKPNCASRSVVSDHFVTCLCS